MNTLIFDTETTGIPKKGLHYSTDFKEFPKLVSIAWRLYDENQKVLFDSYHIIRPDGWEISKEASDIHGIDTEDALEQGDDMKTVLRHFIIDCQSANTIVAHNAYFDISIIKANMLYLGIPAEIANEALAKEKRVDTMMKTIKFVQARYSDGRAGKWPKLEELYFKLFDKEMTNTHSAEGDVDALADCYYELLKLKVL